MVHSDPPEAPPGPLRRGWTTGACAAAAAKAAAQLLMRGAAPDPVAITLPGGQMPQFALAHQRVGEGWAEVGIVKDAGDDPDVTHGAMIVTRIAPGLPGNGLVFRAGDGVGTVTRPGLPLPPGEPAINPMPRKMIAAALAEAGAPADLVVTVSIPGGETLATRTLNARLGIVGGLSILGTTGIVIPFSCAAWIDSIHRGIDVARASGLSHIAGSTGSTSEAGVRALYDLPEPALIEMGDFVGGFLKYLRTHPVPRVTIAGGFAKLSKLAQGRMDLHSKRGAVDLAFLAEQIRALGGSGADIQDVLSANSAMDAWARADAAGLPLAQRIADMARISACGVLESSAVALDIALFDRAGRCRAIASDKEGLFVEK